MSLLIAVAIAAFVLTRSLAASNRNNDLRDAAEWYRQGQALVSARQIDGAIDAFRRATVRDRGEKRYTLALAGALALKHDYDGAQADLMTLREAAPEDPEINLQLARVDAQRQDVTGALHFYRSAVYALWLPEQADARRRVRVELVQFLLAHDQRSRAQAELLALATDLPDEAAQHVDVGRLFVAAGDNPHALDQFQRALGLVPADSEALAGAGQAAFQLGNYPLARTYLQRAPASAPGVNQALELTTLVLSSDPLAARVGSAERNRRFLADFSYAEGRLRDCLAQPATGPLTDEDAELQRNV